MYYEHFGLSGAPFEFNPSASVLYMSAGHREALAALEWGLREPSGFTMLVGEIGTGKTTLIYSLLASNHQGVRTAWVANPRISFEEMLRQVLGQLGANQPETAGKFTMLQALDAQLASIGAEDCIAVIIDEAQDLSDDALEDIRLLSNFQSLERRRLQIVLVGQIDLAKRLARPQLRQLNQRIGARALLPTLQGREIYDYIEYRIHSCGGDIERIFTRGAIREVSRASGGIPRRINVLCHNALLLAFADGQRCVAERHVRDATRDYDYLIVDGASAPAKMAASASAAMQSASTAMRSAGASMRSAAASAASSKPAMQFRRSRRVLLAGVSAALFLIGIAAARFFELRIPRDELPTLAQRLSQAVKLRTPIMVERNTAQLTAGSDQAKLPALNNIELAPVNVHSSVRELNELIMLRDRSPSFSASGRDRKEPQAEASAAAPVKLSSAEKAPPPAPVTSTEQGDDTETRPAPTVLVRAGDTLGKIAMRIYGSIGTDDISRLTAANPEIKDANVIYPGQTIRVQQDTK